MFFLINASNLHVGGGVQVATSFICELAARRDEARDFVVWMSSAVFHNVQASGCTLSAFSSFRVLDIKGRKRFPDSCLRELSEIRCIFTIFGPLYHKVDSRSVVGFAQPWIIYPENECYAKLSWAEKLRSRLKFFLQKKYFQKNSDILVVEAEHVKQQLVLLGVKPASKIVVVHNTISALYQDESIWSDFSVDRTPGKLSVGFIGRNYLHKNVDIIPEVRLILADKYGVDVDFYVTFTDEEWGKSPEVLRRAVKNVGALKVVDCPGFYSSLDAVFFPSLLECFSATPLEAMAMSRPVFLSDRPFNRDVSGDHAFYFDPMSAESAADVIYDYFSLPNDVRIKNLELARLHAINFSSASERADKYLEVIFNGVNRVQ